MPARSNDVAFGFDPRPFTDGIKKAIGGLEGLTAKVTHVAGQIVKKLLVLGVAVKGVQFLWNKFKQGAPEIAKAFDIASDIVFKNFFWPLRQALLPVLQGMLDWVRDHRTAFVKWGGIVVSIFHVAVQVAKSLWGVLKAIVDAIAPRFKSVFSQGFMDVMNLFLVKIAFLTMLITDVLKSMAGSIGGIINDVLDVGKAIWDLVAGWLQANQYGDSFWTLIKNIGAAGKEVVDWVTLLAKGLLAGLKDSLKNVMTPLNDIVKSVRDFFAALKNLDERTGVFTGTMRILGALLGGSIMVVLEMIDAVLLSIVQGFEMLPNLIGSAVAWIKGDKAGLAAFKKEREDLAAKDRKEWEDRWSKFNANLETQKNAIMGGVGAIHAPTPLPGTTAPAAADATTMASPSSTSNVNLNLNVTEGSARGAAKNAMDGVYDSMRRQKLLGGY